MKKVTSLIIVFCIACTLYPRPIHAQDSLRVLVHIEEAQEMYLLEIKEASVHVYIVSKHLYLPLSCLNNEGSLLQSITFSSAPSCIQDSLSKALSKDITYYANIHMKTLLKSMKIPTTSYDFKTLHSLCEVGRSIKDKLTMNTLINFNKYIDTNLSFNAIYDLYTVFKKDIKIKYYTMQYYVVNKKYIALERGFYLKKKAK